MMLSDAIRKHQDSPAFENADVTAGGMPKSTTVTEFQDLEGITETVFFMA